MIDIPMSSDEFIKFARLQEVIKEISMLEDERYKLKKELMLI